MEASNTVIRLALLGSLFACASAGAQAQYCPRDVTRHSLAECFSGRQPRPAQVPVAQQLLPHEQVPYGYVVPQPYAVPQSYVVHQPHVVAHPVPPPAVYAQPYPYAVRDDVGPAVAAMGAILFGAALTRGMFRGPVIHLRR